MIYVPGAGSTGANLMLLSDCPTYEDTKAGQLLSGSDGRELNFLLKDAGIHREDCWTTSVSKFQVPPNVGKKRKPFHVRAKENEIDIQKQLEELQVEINSLKPNCILAMGSAALWALKGLYNIQQFRGSIMMGMGKKYVPTFHPNNLVRQQPSYEFKGYWNRQIILFDIIRAHKQSKFPEHNPPYRTLEICRSSHQLQEFWNRYKNTHTKIYPDIEAHGSCLPACIGFAFKPNHGICVPLWNCDNLSNIPDNDMVQIWRIVSEMLMYHDVVGQNFNYDRDKIKRLGFKIKRIAGDLMLKGFAINPELPKNLAFFTSIYTEEMFYKDDGMYQGSIESLLTGCARDSCVSCEVDLAMDPDLDELEQRPYYENFLLTLPDFYAEIESNGFTIDPIRRDELLRRYIEWDERIRYELFQLCGVEVNVNSPKQISILLFTNFKLPLRSGTGEEELTSLLNLQNGIKDPAHRRVVELILEGRRVRKTISTYLMALPDYDGRMKTTCFPCLETGRSSNGQQEPPIRPTVEVFDEHGKKKNKPLGIAFQTMTKHGDIGNDVRSMYIPW